MILALATTLLGVLLPQDDSAAAPPRPPNIVLLFSDDAGWADFGFQPHAAADCRELTPRIDSIARDGARFDAAYVSGAVCSPSRAGLLTGRYQQRFGHELNLPPGHAGGLDLGQRTLADRLGGMGLATALVGKWHLGYPDAYHPNRRGFAFFHGLLQGSRSYRPLADPSPHRVIQENGRPLPEVGHVTDRFGAAAAGFIAEHKDRPFFLMVSFTATHGPLQPKPADRARVPEGVAPRRGDNLGLLVGLDRAVGRVLDALAEHGLADRTLVVFTNDNGGQTQTGADNGPLRGRKGMVFEGGVRVPMALRWPGVVQPGTVIAEPVILLDLLPTFVVAAGGRPAPEWLLDGLDLGPRLRGEVAALPERPLFWRTLGSKGPVALRRGPWKLVHLRDRPESVPQLFQLDEDLAEQHDRAADESERVQRMLAEVAAWEAELAPPAWGMEEGR